MAPLLLPADVTSPEQGCGADGDSLDPGFVGFWDLVRVAFRKKDASISLLVKWKFCFSKPHCTHQMFSDKQMKSCSEEGPQGM